MEPGSSPPPDSSGAPRLAITEDGAPSGEPALRVAAGVIPGPTTIDLGGEPDRPALWGRLAAIRATSLILGPILAGSVTAAAAREDGTGYESGVLVFLAFAVSVFALRRPSRHLRLLPFPALLVRAAPVVVGAAIVYVVHLVTGLPDDLSWVGLVMASLLAGLPVPILGLLLPPAPPVRVALIGSGISAEMLSRELMVAGMRDHRLVGIIHPADAGGATGEDGLPLLGTLDELGRIVQAHQVELLLMTGNAPRLAVFDELARSCLHLPVRLWELSAFYEEQFGHVPVAEINASWFQYIMHPRYRATGGVPKRVLDLALSAVLSVLLAPLIAILGLLVKMDGGPAFFRQDRIGEGGRPFTLVKLRTMVENAGEQAQWASADDPRTTRVGRLLRKTHLDELPQLWNVLRGEMSLVGPRPEQPTFVERLESAIPFYSRRHLVKPGVTGWAQVRCGYAGSDFGSAWKLCHDLYYLKHRSFWLDIAILIDTLRTLVADPQYDVEPVGVSFILRPALNDDETAAVAAL